jgi:hypothetical protein
VIQAVLTETLNGNFSVMLELNSECCIPESKNFIDFFFLQVKHTLPKTLHSGQNIYQVKL